MTATGKAERASDKASRAGQRAEKASQKSEDMVERLGHALVRWFHLLALFVIGATIVWSAITFYLDVMHAGRASVHDILLLFIYLELGAMVGIYFQTDELPVEFLLYIAITVITRSLVSIEELSDMRVVVVTSAILVLAVAIFMLRWGGFRFATRDKYDSVESTDLPG
jgi:phosphate starvation-inducible membrane PsiE